MAWYMDSLDDLKELYLRIKEKNIEIERVSDHGHAIGIYIRDPDGNGIEVSYEMPSSEWGHDPNRYMIGGTQRGRLPGRLRGVTQMVAQTWSRDELQGQKGLAVVLADFQNRHDVRVAEPRGGLGLAPETLDRVLIRLVGRGQHLDRHLAAQPHVLSPVDNAHATSAQLVGDAVVTQRLANQRLRHDGTPDPKPSYLDNKARRNPSYLKLRST